MKLLITGGSGFIGSNFIRLAIRRGATVINVDALTYAGNRENLRDIEGSSQYSFEHVDIRNRTKLRDVFKKHSPLDGVLNFAAESHVDRSIVDPMAFVETNVDGTGNLLLLSREFHVPRYIQISTDEVYGALKESDPPFTETLPLKPNSPYSASKAGADHLVMAYMHTYNFPALITRCSNNYGPFQFPEKFISLLVTNAIREKNLPIYAEGKNVRDWIYVEDHCEGIWLIFDKGRVGEVYNLGGNAERRNIDVAKQILSYFPESSSRLEFVADRPGHDFRYAMNISKITNELGWKPRHNFENGLSATIEWYKNHSEWWKALLKL